MPRPDRPYSQPQTTAKPRLLDQVREVLRRKHYSIRTEQSYVDWIKRSMYDREIVRAGEREIVRA